MVRLKTKPLIEEERLSLRVDVINHKREGVIDLIIYKSVLFLMQVSVLLADGLSSHCHHDCFLTQGA